MKREQTGDNDMTLQASEGQQGGEDEGVIESRDPTNGSPYQKNAAGQYYTADITRQHYTPTLHTRLLTPK